MGEIYQKSGQSVYDNGGVTYSATTGQPVVPPTLPGIQYKTGTTQLGGGGTSSEPSVLSSATISDQVIPDNQTKLNQYSQKGTYQDSNGLTHYADGSLVSAPVGASYNTDTGSWESGGKVYGSGPQYIANPTNDPDIDAENNLLESLKMSGDSTLVRSTTSIQRQYDQLRAEQESQNQMASKSRARTLQLTGESRYSPLTAQGTMLAQANYGLKLIHDLDTKEDAALATAEAAHTKNDMALMDKSLSIVEEIRKQKADAAKTVSDQLTKANEAAKKTTEQITLDNAVATVMGQGITDPAQIVVALNANGNKYTAEQVANSMKNLTPAKKTTTDAYTFDHTDTGKLLGAGLNATQIQALQDYYNGHGNAPTLTPTQTAAVQSILSGKTASASGSAGSSTFSQTQTNQGASNAGTSITTFKTLDPDSQNFFVNTFPSSQLKKDIALLGTDKATKTAEEIAALVETANIPEAAKPFIYKQLGVENPTTPESGKSPSPTTSSEEDPSLLQDIEHVAQMGWNGLRNILGI